MQAVRQGWLHRNQSVMQTKKLFGILLFALAACILLSVKCLHKSLMRCFTTLLCVWFHDDKSKINLMKFYLQVVRGERETFLRIVTTISEQWQYGVKTQDSVSEQRRSPHGGSARGGRGHLVQQRQAVQGKLIHSDKSQWRLSLAASRTLFLVRHVTVLQQCSQPIARCCVQS